MKIKMTVVIAALVCAMGVSAMAATSGGAKNPEPANSAPAASSAQSASAAPQKGTQPRQKVGKMTRSEGYVSVISAGTPAPAPLNVNDSISEGDRILTGGQSNAYVVLSDHTELTLAENVNLMVDEYVYDPNNTKDNKASYEMIEGMFRYVGGSIGKSGGKSDDVRVNIDTPVGTIDIRGAEFIIESDGTPDILQIALISGSIAVTPTGGGDGAAPTAGPTMTGPLQIQVTPDGTQSLPMTRAQYDKLLAQYFPATPTP